MTAFGFTPRELAGLAANAAQATFLDGAARARLAERIRSGWAALAASGYGPRPAARGPYVSGGRCRHQPAACS